MNIGPKIGIDGEPEYRRQLTNIVQQAKTLDAEMRAVTSTFDENTSSQEKAAAQVSVLTKQLEAQGRRLDLTKEMYDKAKEKLAALGEEAEKAKETNGENSKEAQKAQRAYEDYAKSVDVARGNMLDASAATNRIAREIENLETGVADAGDSMEAAGKKAISLGDLIKGNVISQAIIGGVKGLADAFGGLVRKLGDGLKTLVTKALTYNATIEQFKTSFKVMTGSAEKAQKIVETLREYGAKTPFELEGLAQTTQTLMTYGFTAEEVMEKLAMLGDVSQGSQEKMDRISTAWGKMNATGKVALEQINQMTEAGFSPLQEISEKTGESMESLYSRISKGTLSLEEIEGAFSSATGEGGKFFNSAMEQSQTFTGQLSTLSDTINTKLGEAFQPVSDVLQREIFPELITMLDELDTTKLSEGIETAVRSGADFIMNVDWGAFFQDTSDFIGDMAKNLPTVVENAGKFFGFFASIGSTIGEYATDFKDFWNTTWQNWKDLWGVEDEGAQHTADTSASVAASREGMAAASKSATDDMIANDEARADAAEESAARAGGAYEGFKQSGTSLSESTKESKDEALESADELTDGLDDAGKQAATDAGKNSGKIVDEWQRNLSGLAGLADDAYDWGADFSRSFAEGMRSQTQTIRAAALTQAQTVAEIMHHTHPDKGPMANDHTWGPDFVKEFAQGMEANTWLLADAANKAAATIEANFVQAKLLRMPAAPTMTVQDAGVSIGHVSVTVDAKNIKELNDVVRIAQREAMSIRQGYVDH